MKGLLKLIKENIKTKIQTRRVLRNNLYKQDELMIEFAELLVEYKSVLEMIKQTNFKDLYIEEHERYKEIVKENRRLRKEVNKYEKENSKQDSINS